MKGSREKRSERKQLRDRTLDFDHTKLINVDKNKVLNNCVHPEIGLVILNKATNIITEETIPQGKLF